MTQAVKRAAEAVPEAVVEERPTHERVAAADQLRDLDFVAAVLDVEPDRVADDHHHARAPSTPAASSSPR